MYYKILKDIKFALNRRYIFSYRDFFFNNLNYYYFVCDNINYEAREQLFILRKLKAYSTVVKIRKKVFFSMLPFAIKNKMRNYLLYNPLLLKVHKNDFFNFIDIYLLLKERIFNYNKKENRFFSFSLFFYQMSIVYSFGNCLKNLELLKSNSLHNILRKISHCVNSFLFILFSFFNCLFVLINLKKNANISSVK